MAAIFLLSEPPLRIALNFSLLWLVALVTRFGLEQQGFPAAPQAFVSDGLWALLLAVAGRRSWVLATLVLLLWSAAYLGDWAFLVAMGSPFDHRDFRYLLDPAFLQATTGWPWWLVLAAAAGTVLAAGAALGLLFRATAPSRRTTWRHGAMEIALLGIVLFHYQQTRHDWRDSSLAVLHAEAIWSGAFSSAEQSPPPASYTGQAGEFGEPLQAVGSAENVLLIVMEGLTGAYLPQVAGANHERPGIALRHTGSWAENGWLVPDFITHARQTLRGLYALLCGDYPKLNGGNPKPMELLGNEPQAAQCLPHLLRRQGYATAFYQAADLEFMSKDLTMPNVGFQQVKGRKSFSEQGLPGSWGASDEVFFAQVIPELLRLDSGAKPWFATLLTVGSHYPFAATPAGIRRHGSAKSAVVADADAALHELLQRLEDSGILEDTLVVVTSDESHGLPGHWLGQNWGLFFALAPDLAGEVRTDVYAAIDTANSILDYLGLYPGQRSLHGRSVFRRYASGRNILFSGWTVKMLDSDGRIHSCTRRRGFPTAAALERECTTLQSKSGRLFDRDYLPVAGDPAKFNILSDLFHASEYRLHDLKNWTTLVALETRSIDGGAPGPLVGDMTIDIPEPSLLMVDLDLEFRGDAASSAVLELRAWSSNDAGNTLPTVILPPLHGGERLRLRLATRPPDETDEVTLSLSAKSPSAGELVLRDYRYALQPPEGGRPYEPAVALRSSSQVLAATRFHRFTGPGGKITLRPVAGPAQKPNDPGGAVSAENAGDPKTASGGIPLSRCETRPFNDSEEQIIRAFLAYYGRPADLEGLAYWSQQLASDPMTNKTAINAFVNSFEFVSRFGDLGTDDLVAHVHYRLFGEVMEDAARAHYANWLRAGRLSLHRLVPEMVGGARPEQIQVLENRLQAARMVITTSAASPESALLQTVSGDPASLETFCARLAGHFPGYVSE